MRTGHQGARHGDGVQQLGKVYATGSIQGGKIKAQCWHVRRNRQQLHRANITESDGTSFSSSLSFVLLKDLNNRVDRQCFRHSWLLRSQQSDLRTVEG